MRRTRRRPLAAFLDSGEGFIDVLFLLLTFFVVQNVWQIHLASLHSRFVHAQKLNFVRAADERGSAPQPADERFIQIIVGRAFVQFDKGGLVGEEEYVFQDSPGVESEGVERAVFESTRRALESLIAQRGVSVEDVLVRLYFERDATVTYTVGVYDALSRVGLKTVQWGLESQSARL